MSESDSFYSHATRKEYKINFSFHCDLSGVVYLFDCVVCGVQYVGSTNTPFRLGFNNYMACYRRFRSGSSVPQMGFFRHFLRKHIMGLWKIFVSLLLINLLGHVKVSGNTGWTPSHPGVLMLTLYVFTIYSPLFTLCHSFYFHLVMLLYYTI